MIIGFMILSCSSKKKLTQIEEKQENKTEQNDSIKAKVKEEDKTESKKQKESESEEKESIIKYKPKINEETKKLEPFNYKETVNGKTTKEININGNGEVEIKTITKSFKEQLLEEEKKFKALELDYNAMKKSKEETEKKLNQREKEVKSSTFNLWLIIIILSLLLAISGYFNFRKFF